MKWLKWLVRGLVALALFAAAGAVWLLGTESGLRWALEFAPADLELEAPRGTLTGTISFRRVAYQAARRARSHSRSTSSRFSPTRSRWNSSGSKVSSQEAGRKHPNPQPPSFRIRVADAQVKSVVFEGYEIHDLTAEYSGSGSRHEVQAAFSGAGARARLKGLWRSHFS